MIIRLGRWQCSLLALIVYLLLMSLLCSLGFWQLRRSDEKRLYLEQQQQIAQLPVADWHTVATAEPSTAKYRKVRVSGQYDSSHQFLVDNQMIDGKVGYFVLTPLRLANGQALLVNRGWVPLGQNRNELPVVAIETQTVQITGRLNDFPGVGIQLKGGELPGPVWPAVLQWLDGQVLSDTLGYSVYPLQLELDPQLPDGYNRQWQSRVKTAIPPEKHVAYAVQWFGLALTLTVLFFWISYQKQINE